jgi:hypothetical protein
MIGKGKGKAMDRITRRWRRCKQGMFRNVHFALDPATVRLLSTFVYRSGRVYHVEDIKTGHRDFVGVEHMVNILSE